MTPLRRSRLRRHTPLRRTTPLRRGPSQRAPQELVDAPAESMLLPLPHDLSNIRVRWALWARCRGLCDVGGEPLSPRAWDPHHRVQTSLGGTDCPCNLLVVCRAHHDLIHHPLRSKAAHDAGYLLRSHQDPAAQPVFLHGKRWVQLAVDLYPMF